MNFLGTFTRLLGLGLLSLLSAEAATTDRAQDKPNVIIILGDDVGLGNISCYGADNYRTPNIDALARSGIRFTHCYATPLCGPSRCELMTGLYPCRTGADDQAFCDLITPETQIMIPAVLKTAGYVTAQVGKWHQLPNEPSDWGFDEYLRFDGSGKYWRNPGFTSYTVNRQKVDMPADKYMPDLMHQFLVDFITRHRDQPFFVYYALSHIHGVIQPTPDSKPNSTPQQLFADNITYMDKLVGLLTAKLDELHLRRKTLLLYAGDNGTDGGNWVFGKLNTPDHPAPSPASISPIGGRLEYGFKGQLKEGGSRVPLIASLPGTVPAGEVSDQLVDLSDFFPTLAAMAGASLPKNDPLDGRSFLPVLQGGVHSPRQWTYVQLHGNYYVCDEKWKLTNHGAFFDLRDAPFREIRVPPSLTLPEPRIALQTDMNEVRSGKVVIPEEEANLDRLDFEKDLLYSRSENQPQYLDLYIPSEKRGPYPLVVWIHGGEQDVEGGKNDKAFVPPLGVLGDQGYVLASLDFRRAFPAQLDDVKSALLWLRQHAADYHIDPSRIGVWGESGGGMLAALLGTSQENGVQAVCTFSAPTDFTGRHGTIPGAVLASMLGPKAADSTSATQAASPLFRIAASDPPFFIVQGTADPIVPPAQSQAMADALRAKGVDVTLQLIPGAGHGGNDFSTPDILRQVREFFNHHLGAGASAGR